MKHLKLVMTLALCTASLPVLGDSNLTFKHPGASSAHDRLMRNLTCYIVDGISGSFNERCVHEDDGHIDLSHIPEAAQEQLAAAKSSGTNTFALIALREWWNTWSYALRPLRSQDKIITSRLSEFKALTDFKSWNKEILAKSPVKQKTRVLYRSPSQFAYGISVAETYNSVTGDISGKPLETEVVIDRNDRSGNADFYSYNEQGILSTTSMFPSGERPTPGFCMGCHYDGNKGTFNREPFVK